MNPEPEDNWESFPLFAPEGTTIPQLPEQSSGEGVSSAVAALSHLLYDEETPLEASELLRDEGNRYFKRGGRFVLHMTANMFLDIVAKNSPSRYFVFLEFLLQRISTCDQKV